MFKENNPLENEQDEKMVIKPVSLEEAAEITGYIPADKETHAFYFEHNGRCIVLYVEENTNNCSAYMKQITDRKKIKGTTTKLYRAVKKG